MFNSRGRQTSQPITIKSIHQDERHRHVDVATPPDSDDDIDVHLDAHHNDQDHNHNQLTGGHGNGHHEHHHSNNDHRNNHNLSASFLNSNFDNLTVGSLPSSRRERRFMVTNGNHERYTGAGITSTSSSINTSAGGYHDGSLRSSLGHGQHNFNSSTSTRYGNVEDLSRSMPNAPFIASRRDRASGVRLSRIPCMRLPESVTDSEASSVPYGSLNESQFRFPLNQSKPESEDRGNDNVASSYGPRSVSGLGQPLDIQMRVQQMRKEGALVKNDVSGLTSLFGARNNGDGDGDLNKKEKGGIDALSSWPMSTGIGSQLSGSGRQEQQQSPPKDENTMIGGIGSVIQQSSLSQQIQSQTHTNSNANVNVNVNGQESSITPSSINTSAGQNDYSFRDGGAETNDGKQLSTSLTGLSILQTSPKNMVNLERDQREALANLRSRTFSEEESRNINGNGNGNVNGIIPGIRRTSRAEEMKHSELSWNAVRRLSNGSQNLDPDDGDDATGGGLFDFEMDI